MQPLLQLLIAAGIGAVLGFVAGILVGRKHPATVEQVVGDAKKL